LEDFYNKISDPKLKDVTFEYLVNGKRILPENLTTTAISQVFGSNEYSIAGTFPEDEEINEIQVILNAKDQSGLIEKLFSLRPCYQILPVTKPNPLSDVIPNLPIPDRCYRCFPTIAPQPIWEQSPTEQFMERLWAYKRINYLSEDNLECTKGIDKTIISDNNADTTIGPEAENEDEKSACKEEATRLALKYNFVTDLTSLVIEEDDDYIKKGPVEIGKIPLSSNLDSFLQRAPTRFASFAHSSGGGNRKRRPVPQPGSGKGYAYLSSSHRVQIFVELRALLI
jgi:hypothetical protein